MSKGRIAKQDGDTADNKGFQATEGAQRQGARRPGARASANTTGQQESSTARPQPGSGGDTMPPWRREKPGAESSPTPGQPDIPQLLKGIGCLGQTLAMILALALLALLTIAVI